MAACKSCKTISAFRFLAYPVLPARSSGFTNNARSMVHLLPAGIRLAGVLGTFLCLQAGLVEATPENLPADLLGRRVALLHELEAINRQLGDQSSHASTDGKEGARGAVGLQPPDSFPVAVTKLFQKNADAMRNWSALIYAGAGVLGCSAVLCCSERNGEQTTSPERHSLHAAVENWSWSYLGAVAWAFACGISIALHSKAFVVLNGRSDKPLLHSISVVLTQSTGVCALLFPSMCGDEVRCRPPLWALLSGPVSMLSICIPVACKAFGITMTLTALLMGSLTAALLIDLARKPEPDWSRPLGIFLIISSTPLIFPGEPAVHREARSVEMLCLCLTTVAGANFALQAMCNQRVGVCLGSPLRASLVCNLGVVAAWGPFWLLGGMYPRLDAEDLWLWVFCIAQNIFCIASLSILPGLTSYAATFTASVSGQLMCGAVIDVVSSRGFPSGQQCAQRCFGLVLAVAGAVICALATPSARNLHDGSGSGCVNS